MQKLYHRVEALVSRNSTLLLVILLSVSLVVARRPDALSYPQFWAEDGTIFFAQAYNNGPLVSLFAPYSGSLQTVQRIAASIGTVLPIRYVPLLFNLIAIGIQVLPVVLLWTPRYSRLIKDKRARALVSFIYLAIPNSYEINANVTNANWHLSLVAVMVLVSSGPVSKAWKWFDRVVLALIGLSGPFTFFLMPVALVQWWKDRKPFLFERLCILSTTTLIQGILLLTSPRLSPGNLGVSVHNFIRIVAGQIFLAPLLGGANAQNYLAIAHVAAIVFILGAGIVAFCVWKGPLELKLLFLFSLLLFVGSLIKPLAAGAQPPWVVMTHIGAAARYFLAPMITWIVCLVWLLTSKWAPVRVFAATLLAIALLVGIPAEFRFTPYVDLNYKSQARVFEKLPSGSKAHFKINPDWYVDLKKH